MSINMPWGVWATPVLATLTLVLAIGQLAHVVRPEWVLVAVLLTTIVAIWTSYTKPPKPKDEGVQQAKPPQPVPPKPK